MSVVLVTGAGGGIGQASALYIARQGHRVFGSVRNPESARFLTEVAHSAGVEVEPVELDVTDAAACERAVARVGERAGSVEVLVNNAGRVMYAPVEETTDAEARALLDVNLLGALRMIRAVLPGMRAARRGTIVNVSSVNAIVNLPFSGMYGATKRALEGLSESLALELAAFGIRVRVVEPSGYKTSIVENALVPELPGPSSPYWDGLQRMREASRATNDLAPDLTPVAEAIHAAAFDDRPELRRPVGLHAPQVARMRRELDDVALFAELAKMIDDSSG
jgi:NAD(P)-dependent dehydrogenase (short-subunit alcohol dehydrogenase family)